MYIWKLKLCMGEIEIVCVWTGWYNMIQYSIHNPVLIIFRPVQLFRWLGPLINLQELMVSEFGSHTSCLVILSLPVVQRNNAFRTHASEADAFLSPEHSLMSFSFFQVDSCEEKFVESHDCRKYLSDGSACVEHIIQWCFDSIVICDCSWNRIVVQFVSVSLCIVTAVCNCNRKWRWQIRMDTIRGRHQALLQGITSLLTQENCVHQAVALAVSSGGNCQRTWIVPMATRFSFV